MCDLPGRHTQSLQESYWSLVPERTERSPKISFSEETRKMSTVDESSFNKYCSILDSTQEKSYSFFVVVMPEVGIGK